MSVTVDFIFDFGSPNGYFAYKALPPILERTGAKLNIVPCLLGGIFKQTNNQAPMITFSDVKNKLAYQQKDIMRFIAKHDLTEFTFNSNFPVNTLMMMRAAIVIEEQGRLNEYVEAGLKMMWEDSLKMDDPEVFSEELTKAGFDGNALLAATQDPAIKAKLLEKTNAAVERGAFGVPSFFVGDEMFFGKDHLVQLEDEIIAQST